MQRGAGVSIELEHEAAPHGVEADQSWQAPWPSQFPLMPQAVAAVAVHCVEGTGAVPAETLAHVPSAAPVSACAHAVQVPAQSVSQHTPSTQ